MILCWDQILSDIETEDSFPSLVTHYGGGDA